MHLHGVLFNLSRTLTQTFLKDFKCFHKITGTPILFFLNRSSIVI